MTPLLIAIRSGLATISGIVSTLNAGDLFLCCLNFLICHCVLPGDLRFVCILDYSSSHLLGCGLSHASVLWRRKLLVQLPARHDAQVDRDNFGHGTSR